MANEIELDLDKKFLNQETEKVLDAISSPVFIAEMQAFRSKKGEERVKFAMENLIPDVLSKKGAPLPPDLRISSRTFEEDWLVS